MTNQVNFDKEVNDNTAVDTAIDKAQKSAVQAQQKVGETASIVKEQAMRTAAQVGEQAKTTVDSRMSDVAHELDSVADVVRQTSQEVGGGQGENVARYGERIAGQIEGISSYLDEHGVDDVLTDIQDFARRQPAVFLGGAFMLGLAVGRFLRSSGERVYTNDQESNIDRFRTDYPGSDYRGAEYDPYAGQSRYQSGVTQRNTTTQQTGTSPRTDNTTRNPGSSGQGQ